ncbi:serine/threonine-protein kinase [Planctomonas psychrotolerans]|uniref:serine/threonine-protein kinase n=1 Tax=Planctomonas psychrotolerans TaxID=2528712 RepID=UPI00123AA905|nr:serine/threonine-protein kinase [Planctomonas psychrotolerans]
MARRLPSTPPTLPGFSYITVLGSGGFADVFLYEQNLPRRQVAVKVMLAEVVNDSVRQMFQAEANLMAQLSTHPSILTVYQASVSADGRPYLVMELCSSSLGQRYRRESIPVADVLRIGIKIASAVETAHRAGVLHRDIKPSNILTTAYGNPVLSDFGIAATLSESDTPEAVGLSIPWSAPEVLNDDSSGTIASEVWSLGATIYSLLAGRSPFEVTGGSNTSADLIARIAKAKPGPIGRADVSPQLERTLQRAMSKRPDARPGDVMELIRELQSAELELGVAQTPVEVAMDDWALATVADLDDRTRIKGVPAVNPDAPGRRRRRQPVAAASGAQSQVGTLIRQSRSAYPTGTGVPRPSRQRTVLTWALVAVAVLAIAFGATATAVMIRSTTNDLPRVGAISASTTENTVVFSWADPGRLPDDRYEVRLDGQPSVQQASRFTSAAEPGDRVCVTVAVVRNGTTGAPSSEKCVDF